MLGGHWFLFLYTTTNNISWAIENIHDISKPIPRSVHSNSIHGYSLVAMEDSKQGRQNTNTTHPPPRGHLTCQFSRSPKIHHHATVSTAGFSESTTNNTAVGLENAKPIKCTRDLDLYCVKIVGLGPHGWKGVDEATSWKGEIWNMWTAFSRTIGGLITHSLALWHFSTVHTPKVQHVRASAHNRMELSSEFMTNKEPFPASPSTGGWCNNNN